MTHAKYAKYEHPLKNFANFAWRSEGYFHRW